MATHDGILDVAISPCPNDTFAFFSLSENPAYGLHYLDIEELNQGLLAARFPLSKGSFALIDKIADRYDLLLPGAAIGRGVGPVLVGRLSGRAKLALPGENTTAHRLFRYWLRCEHPDLELSITQMPFNEILPALRRGELDAAVLIHEGRFVYAREGLPLIEDLGAWYENKTGAMIPLGCIYARKDVPAAARAAFSETLKTAIRRSRSAYRSRSPLYNDRILPHMQQLAQEREVAVVEAHVDTYVTDDTEWLSAEAVKSIDAFRKNCLT